MSEQHHCWFMCLVLAGSAVGAAGAQEAPYTEEALPPLGPDLIAPEPAPLGEQLDPPDAAKAPCLIPADLPLSAMSIDSRPRDKQGAVVAAEDQPRDCWTLNGQDGPPRWIDGGSERAGLACRTLLQGARFCHRPIYFEDEELERCGQQRLPDVAHATQQFVCDLAQLPISLRRQPPRSCVRAPTPHCCTP